MRVARRLLPLLLCGLLAAVPATVLAQGGAGDDQYQDPFAGQGSDSGRSGNSSGSNSGSTGTTTQSGGNTAPELTQNPDLGSSTPAPTPAAAPATSGTAGVTTSRSELPRTGFDAPEVALLGIGLLAAGIGLRLRVAHGRRP